jgi:2-polyprenyl-3-methyl-5-hydroxy-6-metoxy-1,4-benzoquinol methylase
MYNRFADVYEAIAAQDYGDAVFPMIRLLLLTEGVQAPSAVLDLGCGTGTLACQLAKLGWRVTGVDLSRAMLAIAFQKAGKYGVTINPAEEAPGVLFGQGDITELKLTHRYRMITCLCNTINHLIEPEKVQGFFQSLAGLLDEGGLAVVESDLLETFLEYFDTEGEVTMLEAEHDVITREAHFDKTLKRVDHWARHRRTNPKTAEVMEDEEFIQLQYWEDTFLLEAIEAAGLSVRSRMNWNPIPKYYDQPFDTKQWWLLERKK